jgi:hypothetical protein
MCLVASGALVIVKLRAIEKVKIVKILPVETKRT